MSYPESGNRCRAYLSLGIAAGDQRYRDRRPHQSHSSCGRPGRILREDRFGVPPYSEAVAAGSVAELWGRGVRRLLPYSGFLEGAFLAGDVRGFPEDFHGKDEIRLFGGGPL